MIMNGKDLKKTTNSQDLYDFSGPLWEKYHEETRNKVRFPRGYREVSILKD
ncbi:MAG: hypothetical protein ACJAU0_000752 [Flavobacteriales bacterium]|jgi:hypothetical protein